MRTYMYVVVDNVAEKVQQVTVIVVINNNCNNTMFIHNG